MAASDIYIGDFNLELAYQGDGSVPAIYLGDDKVYPTTPHDYSSDYFTTRSLADNNTITWSGNTTCYHSTDGGTNWIQGNSVTLNSGGCAMWKDTAQTQSGCTFITTENYAAEGNIMSLLYGDNFLEKYTLETDHCFTRLFQNSSKLCNISNLILPATTLSMSCYYGMFLNCTNITDASSLVLPATVACGSCYSNMFYGCTSLTTPPSLPATTVEPFCYSNMFGNCRNMATAPALPATELNDYCYSNMFYGCTSLTTAPELPATNLSSVTFCYSHMFEGCTSLTEAPELPATTLKEGCYNMMFKGSTSLSSVTCLATDISANNCTYAWLSGVAASGTFYKSSNMNVWPSGSDGIPTGWTVQDYTG